MSGIYITKAEIILNNMISDGVYSLTVLCKPLADEARPGQFAHIKCDSSLLLRRPISICSVNGDEVRFIFEIKGEGTKWLAEQNPGQSLDIIGPLGNGFILPDGRIIVVGGGIGTPPMLFAALSAKNCVTAILGFRSNENIILADEFGSVCTETIITTDDGSAGLHGFVTAPLEELLMRGKYDAVLSCGPYGMQKSVAKLCKHYNVPCQISLEERMGCGVGACLVCVCSATINGTPEMKRVCADGPVFDAAVINL